MAWLTLVLLFVVLVPSVGLVWFMRQTVRNEQLAVRQQLIEAYRAQLAGAQERLAATWPLLAAELPRPESAAEAATMFERVIRQDVADAIVCLGSNGERLYPNDLPDFGPAGLAPRSEDASPDDQAARDLQEEVREALRTGETERASAALAALQEPRFRHAIDTHGRALVANTELLAIESWRESAPERAALVRDQLQARVLDYGDGSMSSAQRRFLLRRLQQLFPPATPEPILAAEDLAANFLAEVGSVASDPALRATPLTDVWQHTTPDGRFVLLHRGQNLSRRFAAQIGASGLPAGVRLAFVPPGQDVSNVLLSRPAGNTLPGWLLAIVSDGPLSFDAATDARVNTYAWIVAVAVCAITGLALLAWGLVRRQIALTQLRNDLVANVTHELKTPLASMRLLVETLLHAPRLEEKTTREYLQLIATENLRLSRLIGNFLTFSRIERNKYTFDFRTVPAHELVDGAVAAVRDRFQGPEQRLEIDASPDLPTVNADPDALTTALVNLLDNAWKYTGESKHVVLQAAARNGSVVFAVRDNGIGMEPGEAQRIFDRFYQVRQPQAAGGGAGLGLSIVQFVVQAHRGSIEVQSAVGRGSTFTITLPVEHSQPRS